SSASSAERSDVPSSCSTVARLFGVRPRTRAASSPFHMTALAVEMLRFSPTYFSLPGCGSSELRSAAVDVDLRGLVVPLQDLQGEGRDLPLLVALQREIAVRAQGDVRHHVVEL